MIDLFDQLIIIIQSLILEQLTSYDCVSYKVVNSISQSIIVSQNFQQWSFRSRVLYIKTLSESIIFEFMKCITISIQIIPYNLYKKNGEGDSKFYLYSYLHGNRSQEEYMRICRYNKNMCGKTPVQTELRKSLGYYQIYIL